ncbi:TPA: phage DNA ejection protein [Escherichia coli]|uniref:phage DNA ejection protein n=2 Tax=Escherichia coli TaxID=562 RepID=UPI00092EFD52|nr:phage DNA ejection protein [Escherichia coli]DAX02963.1 MAG TPA: DNA/protein translocase of phage P22 injectosome [Caudoviricetes sp.]MCC4678077.1 DNA transfer protein [Escherichia coli]MCI4957072.1 DNA transfer protein [Escherichia coli]MCN8186218.1 DNA transfer protein [Escherichia coli]MCV5000597.1 DNA transfer protein [Escherichia coli]
MNKCRLLAGIGGVNSNAPSVNDIGNTLQLIRQNNDIERSGANNVGLTALQGLSGIAGVFQQEKQAQRQKEFQQAYAKAYASGDRGALRQLATQYPDQIESVRKGMGFIDEDQRNSIGTLAAGARLASSSPEAMQSWLQNNAKELTRVGVDPNSVAQMYQQNPSGFGEFVDHLGMAALGPIDYFNVQDKIAGREIDRGRLAETIRSNQAGEALTARGQNITMRGQDLSMQRASMKGAVGNNERTVQLADGRTVTVGGKLHGAGANAFYEGIDNEGNMVRVPAGSIAAPATSAASAQNYAMKKDLDAISGASIDDLGFMTGITGSSGSPALGADIRSRASGGDQRKLYNAAQRIQGKMQNQGIAAARDMGASGINTVAEAKMYFQGMPQVDFSSPEALQQSMRDIQQYTDNYNQQYNVNVGNGGKKSSRQQPATQQSAGGSYTSKSGIQFTVE